MKVFFGILLDFGRGYAAFALVLLVPTGRTRILRIFTSFKRNGDSCYQVQHVSLIDTFINSFVNGLCIFGIRE
jgi:hypothetical protein